MEAPKPKMIRIIGWLVIIIAGIIIFSNIMGALIFLISGFGGDFLNDTEEDHFHFIGYLFDHYLYMCVIMVIIGLFYLIGGLNIQKYKLWANKLVTYMSIGLLLLLWFLMYEMTSITQIHAFNIGAFTSTVVWSMPIIIIIGYLNTKSVKRNFK